MAKTDDELSIEIDLLRHLLICYAERLQIVQQRAEDLSLRLATAEERLAVLGATNYGDVL
jgi:hypothetical protein